MSGMFYEHTQLWWGEIWDYEEAQSPGCQVWSMRLVGWITPFCIDIYNQQIHSMRNVLLRPKVVLNLKRMWPKVFLGMAARYDRYKRIFIKCTKSNHSNHFKVFFYIRISHLFTSWSYWVYMNQNHWIIRTKKDFIYGSIPLL